MVRKLSDEQVPIDRVTIGGQGEDNEVVRKLGDEQVPMSSSVAMWCLLQAGKQKARKLGKEEWVQ